MDDPKTIFDGALKNHVNLVKQFKGRLQGVGAEECSVVLTLETACCLIGETVMSLFVNDLIVP